MWRDDSPFHSKESWCVYAVATLKHLSIDVAERERDSCSFTARRHRRLQLYPIARGLVSPIDLYVSRIHTIMAYRCGGVDIQYFSNPDVSYSGLPTGIANDADCARRIRETMVRSLITHASCISEITNPRNISSKEKIR